MIHHHPNLDVDRVGDQTCATMNHLFDLPATARPKGGGRWPAQPGPVEGEELGAAFNESKLPRPLLHAIQEFSQRALKKGIPS